MIIDFSRLKDVFSLKTHSHSYNDLSNKPSLANVATSGDYSDLDNTPDLSEKANVDEFDTVEATITYMDDSTDTVELYIVPDNS